ncbi:MAG: hypothetical protein QOK19_564 [Solirubrobacteraceae bacterium]|nr:hypothetical protein [Solirubrobacteraceae bacterium]
MKLILGRRVRSALRGFKVPETFESAAYDDAAGRERLTALAARKAPLRLHLGCGPRLIAGWVNIDLAYQPSADPPRGEGEGAPGTAEDFYAIDVTRGLPLPDGCVEAVFHEDFLEHLSQRDAVAFLAEARRVLLPGAVHRVNSPDLAASMREYSDFARGLEGTYRDEWDRWHHVNVFTPRYLEEIALMVGYSRVDFNRRDGSVSELMPRELRPAPNSRREDGNLFADLVK